MKRSGKSHQSPDHYLKIDQRAEPLPTHEEEEYNDDFEDHSYRSPTSNKRHHVREEIEEVSVSHVLPSSPLIEAIRSFQTNVEEKSDWWSRIMAEKQNRENQAFRQSLIQQQPK